MIKTITLTNYHLGIICGLILSDAWLQKYSNYHVRLGFKQSLAHFEYFWFTFSQLTHYCAGYSSFVIGSRNAKTFYAVSFYTRYLAALFDVYHSFYPLGVKVIPDNIYDLLTPVVLSHFIMGDGAVR